MRERLIEALSVLPQELRSRQLQPVSVAVLDSGVDASHPSLKDRVIESWAIRGQQVVRRDAQQNHDPFGHGTAVASIICELAPNAQIIDLCVLGERANSVGPALLRATEHAVERRVPLINMSLAASNEYASQLHALCERAYREGLSVIAASRNMPLLDHGFPAEFSSVISVDQSDVDGFFHWYFRHAHPIALRAHGAELRVAAAGGGYTTKTGTSFAAPVVTAMCALWLGAFGELRSFDLKTLLRAFAQRSA
jgi:subtilisin family serine protease